MGNRKCYLWHYANKTLPNLESAWPEKKNQRNTTKYRHRYAIVKCDSFLIQFAYEMTQSPLNATLNKSPRDLLGGGRLASTWKYCVNPLATHQLPLTPPFAFTIVKVGLYFISGHFLLNYKYVKVSGYHGPLVQLPPRFWWPKIFKYCQY